MKKALSRIATLTLLWATTPALAQAQESTSTQPIPPKPTPLTPQSTQQGHREYQPKDYSHLLEMQGFSKEALALHFTLYQGYVKNTNLLLQTLSDYAKTNQLSTPQFAELKRRLGWEFDGMRLHELYFDNLGGPGGQPASTSDLFKALVDQFGTYENWKAEFMATGGMRGIGWAVLYQDPVTGRLINTWINEHDLGHLSGGIPLLVMDVFEHAYLLDYGINRGAYIKAFFDNIDWDVVQTRYLNAKK
jgi:Fe-Mn family superoxide dismutase